MTEILLTPAAASGAQPWIRLDRHELAGAFGDIGTDLPLIIGMILAAGLDSASVLIVFGMMQVFSGLRYGMPMAVQPLKAVAAIVIAQRFSGATIYGAGLSIGAIMLVLTVTGLLDGLARIIPKAVVRGIQFGLGLQLSLLALRSYMPSGGVGGLALAIACIGIVLALRGNRRLPAALVVLALGALYALASGATPLVFREAFGLALPRLHAPSRGDIVQGFLLLALPQIPLSLGNSILATRQIAHDLFPDRAVSVRRIGLTYSLMNLAAPLLSGLPVCHGSGGMAGHYAFGGRTGGSVLVYGIFYLILGLCFSRRFLDVIRFFPLPVLGVILLFEGLALLRLSRDMMGQPARFGIVVLVGVAAVALPQGYLIGMVGGTLACLVIPDAAPLAPKPERADQKGVKPQ